jgi:hypothetical protein
MSINWKNWIAEIDFKSTKSRRKKIIEMLEHFGQKYELHHYETVVNLIVRFGMGSPYFAVSCHIDRFKGSGGANDNASSVAVCLALAQYFGSKHPIQENLILLFFDEEESGLRGSKAYIRHFGFDHIHSLVNLELVGVGENIVLWPVYEPPNQITRRIQALFTELLINNQLNTLDQPSIENESLLLSFFPLYSSDAESFTEAGFKNAITLSRIDQKDYINARLYLNGEVFDKFDNLVTESEPMKNYHNKGDNSSIINNHHIQNTIHILIKLIEQTPEFKGSERNL